MQTDKKSGSDGPANVFRDTLIAGGLFASFVALLAASAVQDHKRRESAKKGNSDE